MAICISRFPLSADPWRAINAFLEGFRETEDEIQAIPFLLKLRMLTNVIHFVGRYLGKLDNEKQFVDKLCSYYNRVGWANENSSKIVELFKTRLLR